jgi:hypothetical protein
MQYYFTPMVSRKRASIGGLKSHSSSAVSAGFVEAVKARMD